MGYVIYIIAFLVMLVAYFVSGYLGRPAHAKSPFQTVYICNIDF